MDEVESAFSEKGKPLVIYKKFKFREVPIKDDTHRKWRCTLKTCNAVLFTSRLSNDVIMDTKYVHNHPEPSNLTRNVISNGAKRKALEVRREE